MVEFLLVKANIDVTARALSVRIDLGVGITSTDSFAKFQGI